MFGESENTTQSYSNSLLEDNIGCADNSDNDFEADEQFEDVRLLPDMSRLDISRTAHLSDLDNGKQIVIKKIGNNIVVAFRQLVFTQIQYNTK